MLFIQFMCIIKQQGVRMKNLAAQALAFQYKLQIDNASGLLNNNNAPLNSLDAAITDIVLANQKLQLLNKLVAESNPKEIDTPESK